MPDPFDLPGRLFLCKPPGFPNEADGFLMLGRIRLRAAPVSYPHLDVYKRQVSAIVSPYVALWPLSSCVPVIQSQG